MNFEFLEELKTFRLENGLTVLFLPMKRAALAAVQFWIKSGSIHEGDKLGSGVSHALEHMLFKGSGSMSGEELNAKVEALGGESNAYTTWDRTVYTLDLPSKNFSKGFRLLADMVMKPALRAKDFTLERNVILREMSMYADLPDECLLQNMLETVFAGHPYHAPILGYKDLFKDLTVNDLKEYYTKRYCPNNSFVVICGKLSASEADEAIAYLKSWKTFPLKPICIPFSRKQLGSRRHLSFADTELVYGTVAWQTEHFLHDDFPALEMLASVLAGSDSSYLQEHLVDKSDLALDIDAQAWKEFYAGLFTVDFSTETKRVVDAEKAIFDSFNRLKSIPNLKKRLATSQALQRVSVIRDLQTNEKVADLLGESFFHGGSIAHFSFWQNALQSVTVDDLIRVGERYFSESESTVTMILPKVEERKYAKKRTAAVSEKWFESEISQEARLYALQDESLPYVNFSVYCPFGSMQDISEKAGLSKLLATLWIMDNAGFSAHRFSRELEYLGAELKTNVGYDGMMLHVAFPSDSGKRVLDLLEFVFQPKFIQKTFDREKDLLIGRMREDRDDVSYYALLEAEKMFFGKHPMRLRSDGSEASVSNISRKDIVETYGYRIGKNSLTPMLVGNFDDKVFSRIQEMWKHLPLADAAVRTVLDLKFSPSKTKYLPRSSEQTIVVHTYPFPKKSGENLFRSELLFQLLSGTSAPVFRKVRETSGLAYFAQASARVSRLGGALHLFAGTEKKHAQKVSSLLEEEIMKLSGSISNKSLEIAKATYEATLSKQWQMLPNRASMIQNSILLYGKRMSLDEMLDAVHRVTKDEVSELAKAFLNVAFCQKLFVGDV